MALAEANSANQFVALLLRHPPTGFFLIAFAISWTVVASVVLFGYPVNALVIAAITAGPGWPRSGAAASLPAPFETPTYEGS